METHLGTSFVPEVLYTCQYYFPLDLDDRPPMTTTMKCLIDIMSNENITCNDGTFYNKQGISFQFQGNLSLFVDVENQQRFFLFVQPHAMTPEFPLLGHIRGLYSIDWRSRLNDILIQDAVDNHALTFLAFVVMYYWSHSSSLITHQHAMSVYFHQIGITLSGANMRDIVVSECVQRKGRRFEYTQVGDISYFVGETLRHSSGILINLLDQLYHDTVSTIEDFKTKNGGLHIDNGDVVIENFLAFQRRKLYSLLDQSNDRSTRF